MDSKPSTNNQNGEMGYSKMEITATREIITQLKHVKSEYELTIPRIKEMLEKNGDFLSLSTLRRVFAEHSEDDASFSYERTLAPIARALLFQDQEPAEADEDESAVMNDRLEGLKHVILLKNEQLAEANAKIEELKSTINDLRAEYDLRLRFLRDQIELKDKRMDEKDVIILRLMDKCL